MGKYVELCRNIYACTHTATIIIYIHIYVCVCVLQRTADAFRKFTCINYALHILRNFFLFHILCNVSTISLQRICLHNCCVGGCTAITGRKPMIAAVGISNSKLCQLNAAAPFSLCTHPAV